ncbi:MAG: hypothetical protein QXT34_02150 [Candidatus Aenigmatarchaeota archaeon]
MKSQSALEYFLVSSFVMLVIILGFSYAFRESLSKTMEINLRQIEINIQKIIYYSEMVYSQGEPAKYVLKLNFPMETKVYNITNNTIAVECEKNNFYYILKFSVSVNESFFGNERIEIAAIKDYVRIKKV